MPDQVKSRRYDATRRRAAAEATRAAIITAARELFSQHGYAGTTMAAVAARADVAADTVYASVGPKAALFALLIETALSGRDRPVPGRDRDYAVQLRAAQTLAGKLEIYADAVTAIQQRLALLFNALREAAPSEPALAALWESISSRRAANMRDLAADLATTGEVRGDMSLAEIADVIWTMNSAEYYTMLVADRGWSADRFRAWLQDSWYRLLTPAGKAIPTPGD